MSDHDLVVQQASLPAARLILLFHGVGCRSEEFVPLGRLLAEAVSSAWVVSVRSPESDLGSGWQWFSVRWRNINIKIGATFGKRGDALKTAFAAKMRMSWAALNCQLDEADTGLTLTIRSRAAKAFGKNQKALIELA